MKIYKLYLIIELLIKSLTFDVPISFDDRCRSSGLRGQRCGSLWRQIDADRRCFHRLFEIHLLHNKFKRKVIVCTWQIIRWGWRRAYRAHLASGYLFFLTDRFARSPSIQFRFGNLQFGFVAYSFITFLLVAALPLFGRQFLIDHHGILDRLCSIRSIHPQSVSRQVLWFIVGWWLVGLPSSEIQRRLCFWLVKGSRRTAGNNRSSGVTAQRFLKDAS